MDYTSILLFTLLAVFVLLPVYWAWRMVWLYVRWSKPSYTEEELPKVAVILSLRGADPSLVHCLGGLLKQNYPRYAVRIVVDNRLDPAWDMVHDMLCNGYGENVDVKVSVLEQRRETCSLKVSAQLQAIGELDESYEAVVLIDADSIPAPNWLRSMVGPFKDAQVGACTGIRWFAPRDACWGTLVRHLYNAASFTQMYFFHIPWGGSLAIRTRVLRESPLLGQWSQSFCEDIGTYGVVRDMGLKLSFVTDATQLNQETIELRGCYNFLLRQLLCVRLHHVYWTSIFLANVFNFVAIAVTAGLLGLSLVQGMWGWAAASGGLLAAYIVGVLTALNIGEVLIRRIVRQRGESVPPMLLSWKVVPAALLTQVMSFYCLVYTVFLRRIDWRGITYAIHGPEKIRLLEYRPYQAPVADPSRSVI